MLCFLMFLCCLDSRIWIIKLILFPFFLFFSSPFLTFIFSFFFPFYFFPLSLLSCCLASLPRFTPSAPCLVALPPCCALCYLKLMPHHLVLLPCHLLVPHATSNYLPTLRYLTTWLPLHLRYLMTPPFVVSLPCCFAFSYFTTLCWLVLPSSLLFYKEELGGWRSKLSNN
jgi:hypothetical protein